MSLFGIPYTPRQLHYALGDFLVVVMAIYVAHALHFGLGTTTVDAAGIFHRSVGVSSVFVFSTLLVLYVSDAYNAALDFRRRRELMRLWVAISLAVVLQVLLYAAFPAGWWGPGLAGLTAVSVGLLLPAWRVALCQAQPPTVLSQRTLVVGTGPASRVFVDAVRARQDHDRIYDVVGIVEDRGPGNKRHATPADTLLLGSGDDLENLVRKLNVALVVVAVQGEPDGALTRQLLACKARGVRIEEMPTSYKRLTGKVPILHLPDSWLVFGPQFAGTGRLAAGAQRLADIAIALVGAVLSAPIVAVAALAVKLESRGPAFYLQERLGKNEQPFEIIKLRTMRQDAEAASGAVWSQGSADPRVTRVGRFLRRTRIDELPQFYNVLWGDMSIVGPRPEREHFVKRLKERIPFYSMRFSVKPGVTGWAQVEYRYGATEEDAAEKLCYELYAIQEMSPALYGLIVLKTVQTVLLRPGS